MKTSFQIIILYHITFTLHAVKVDLKLKYIVINRVESTWITQITWTMIKPRAFGLALVFGFVAGMDGGESQVIPMCPLCMHMCMHMHISICSVFYSISTNMLHAAASARSVNNFRMVSI